MHICDLFRRVRSGAAGFRAARLADRTEGFVLLPVLPALLSYSHSLHVGPTEQTERHSFQITTTERRAILEVTSTGE